MKMQAAGCSGALGLLGLVTLAAVGTCSTHGISHVSEADCVVHDRDAI